MYFKTDFVLFYRHRINAEAQHEKRIRKELIEKLCETCGNICGNQRRVFFYHLFDKYDNMTIALTLYRFRLSFKAFRYTLHLDKI